MIFFCQFFAQLHYMPFSLLIQNSVTIGLVVIAVGYPLAVSKINFLKISSKKFFNQNFKLEFLTGVYWDAIHLQTKFQPVLTCSYCCIATRSGLALQNRKIGLKMQKITLYSIYWLIWIGHYIVAEILIIITSFVGFLVHFWWQKFSYG